jgi:hypothetical protein
MRGLLGRLGMAMVCGAILACAPAQDGGAEALRTFFRDLEGHRFDAAADLIRDAGGAPLSGAVRDRYLRGWRKAYEGYDIRFTAIVVRRYPDSPDVRLPDEHVRRAGAVEAYIYDVRFEGTSNSPCVPVSSNVIPGTTQPIAGKQADGTWFLLADGMVGFVDTCPGARGPPA